MKIFSLLLLITIISCHQVYPDQINACASACKGKVLKITQEECSCTNEISDAGVLK